MGFTASQFRSIEIAERVVSAFSLMGTVFILVTFITTPHFRKPINRLVFYASFGNIFMSISTLISREGIKRGPDSPLCQFQAFLIHDFMFADAVWTLAMALNVYLVVFRKYDARDLQRLEKWYVVLCYGLPFVPAFAFCFVRERERGRMFGNATIWCWISVKWEAARIISVYVWIWTLILIIMGIYILVGIEIWRRDRLFSGLSSCYCGGAELSNMQAVDRNDSTAAYQSGELADDEERLNRWTSADNKRRSIDVTVSYTSNGENAVAKAPDAYSVNVSASRQPSYGQRCKCGKRDPGKVSALRTYVRTAFLFWTIFVITWMPPSINRLYSLVNTHGAPIFALSMLSCITLPLQGFWNAVVFAVVGSRGWKR